MTMVSLPALWTGAAPPSPPSPPPPPQDSGFGCRFATNSRSFIKGELFTPWLERRDTGRTSLACLAIPSVSERSLEVSQA